MFLSPKRKRTVDYLTEDKEFNHSFLKTMITDINNYYLALLDSGSIKRSEFIDSLKRDLDIAFENPTELIHDNIRFCTQCGQPMHQGYVLGNGEEYYCSEHCAKQRYSDQDLMVIMADRDHTSDEDIQEVLDMTPEEYDEACSHNDNSYWTEWEWV